MSCSPSLEIPTLNVATRAHAVFDDEEGTECHPIVQFDDTCVVIPDPVVQSRMPRLIKKSYSLPLWRKRSPSNTPAHETEGQFASSPEDKSPMSFTVSVPSFAKSRSPTRGEHGHHHQPLVSCLVNGAEPTPRRPTRRPSLPLPPRTDIATIPLRPCCRECYPITEECLKDGITWEEKFTRGARRRRNSSADAHAHAHAQRHRRVCEDVPGFGAIVSVDEIDRRRGTSSVAPAPAPSEHDPEAADAGLLPSFSRRADASDISTTTAGVIAEEAEDDQLFPLPARRPSVSRVPQLAPGSAPSSPQLPDLDELSRSSVYYTPDSSPAISTWDVEASGSSSGSDSPMSPAAPVTPPQSFARSIPIPSSKHVETVYTDPSLSSFEFVQSPTSSPLLASPSQELSMSPGARRKQFMHMPHLPSAGSFLRAGADIFKGVSVIGGGSVPMSV